MKNKILHLLFVCLFFCASTAGTAQTIYYVDSSKTDNNGNGTSWATAKKDLQDALNMATTAGTYVWVKKGTYYPTSKPDSLNFNTGSAAMSNRDFTFFIRDGVKLYGGFNGTETSLYERSRTNKTILNGDIGTPNDYTDNCYHVILYVGPNTSSVGVTIDGFNIINANAFGAAGNNFDQAIYQNTDYLSYSEGIRRTLGGGIYLIRGTNSKIINCIFQSNRADNRGGGFWFDGGYGNTYGTTISNCFFIRNYSSNYGAGISYNYGTNQVSNNVFHNNTSISDGAAMNFFAGNNKIYNNTITNNTSTTSSAGISFFNTGDALVSNNIFYGNKKGNSDTTQGIELSKPGTYLRAYGQFYTTKFNNNMLQAAASRYDSTSSYYTNYDLGAGSQNNIFQGNPLFTDSSNIQGNDAIFATDDDGLHVGSGSVALTPGDPSVFYNPFTDITYSSRGATPRPTPLGAYLYVLQCPTYAFTPTNNIVLCKGSTQPNIVFTGSPASGVTYTWTATNHGTGIAASGTDSILNFVAANTTNVPIIDTISVKPTSTVSGTNCAGTIKKFTITVYPSATVDTISNQVLCNNTTSTAVNFSSSSSGTVVYNWVNNTTSIGLAASGTGNIAAFTATNATNTAITATITVTPSTTGDGFTCNGSAKTFTISVNPTATVNTISNQTVCNNTSSTAVSFSSPTLGNTVVYNWTNNKTSIGLAASGTGNIAAFNSINTGNSPIIATITVIPIFTNGGVRCIGSSSTFTITVNPSATVNALNNQIICNGSAVAAVNFTTAATGGAVVYNWTNNATSIGLAASGVGNISSFNATNNTNAPVTATITVTPTFTNGGVNCVGTARTFTITVNPTVTVTTISNKTECNGSVTTPIIIGSVATGGSVSYSWTNSNTAIGLAANGTGNIPTYTATNTGTSPIVSTITVTPTFTNGDVSCTSTIFSFTITINPPPVFNAPTNQIACNGTATSALVFSTPLTGGTAVFNWANSNTAIGLGASGTGSLPSFTATNNTNAPISGTVTVGMTYTNAGVSCVSLTQTFTYTVNPTPKVNTINNQTICARSATAAINFSTITGGGIITYNWVNNTAAIGLAASGTGNIPAFTAINTGATPVIATITVTPVITNAGISCTGTPVLYTITINPTPVTVFSTPTPAQCFRNNKFEFTNTTTNGASYLWNFGNGNTATTTNAVESYLSAGVYIVKLISTSPQGCMDSISKTVTVHAQPNKPVVIPEFGNGIHSSIVANNYLWYNNNMPLNNANLQYYLPLNAGYHQVQVTTINGCSEKSDSLYYIPENNFRVGLDGQFAFVYPVPVTNGQINVHFNVPLEHRVIFGIYTDIGQLLQSGEIPVGTRQFKIDVSKYPKANYTLRLQDNYKLIRGIIVPVIK